MRVLHVKKRAGSITLQIRFTTKDGRTRTKGIDADSPGVLLKAITALNAQLPTYVAPVTESEVRSHV